MAATFKGGIHPSYQKALTNTKAIEVLPAPDVLIFPLSQHIGAPCEPLVAVGDQVKLGQKIGDSAAAVSAPIHSSVSGTVKAIEPYNHPAGTKSLAILVENDKLDTKDESIIPCSKTINALTSEEIITMARDAGIAGMGGAGFPLHFKLSTSKGKADTLIINGAECEPYLSSDHRMMLEHPNEIVEGTRLAMKALGLEKGFIGVETNKADAIAALAQYIGSATDVVVVPLEVKYPQGAEKMLIKSITGREVTMGKLPADSGCCVCNADSVGALYRKYKIGVPSYERVVTVTGNIVSDPKVFLVRYGTTFQYAIDHASGVKGEIGKVLSGGPMMGKAQYTTDVPIIKTTSGILLLSVEESKPQQITNCIHCGKCIKVCPTGLVPTYLNFYSDGKDLAELEKLSIDNCCECGACAFTCPANIELTQKFRLSKLLLAEERRAKAAKK